MFFSLALDENTDIRDSRQLLVYIRMIDKNFVVSKELLGLIPLSTTTTGLDIFQSLNVLIADFGGFEKCSCIVTDGARSMTGQKTGLVGCLRNEGVTCPILHCVIHQESLAAKCIYSCDIMTNVTKIINFIRGGNKALRHRLFIKFLKENKFRCFNISLYSQIRWLSATKSLEQFLFLGKKFYSFSVISTKHVVNTNICFRVVILLKNWPL